MKRFQRAWITRVCAAAPDVEADAGQTDLRYWLFQPPPSPRKAFRSVFSDTSDLIDTSDISDVTYAT
jgi:hypothetical protein